MPQQIPLVQELTPLTPLIIQYNDIHFDTCIFNINVFKSLPSSKPVKNTPEPNERDAFLDWVKQAMVGLNRTLWRLFQTDVQQLVSRYADIQEQQQQQLQPISDLSLKQG